MKIMEGVLLAAASLLVIFVILSRGRGRGLTYLSYGAVLLAFVQIAVESFRWQMIPAYVLCFFLAWGSLPLNKNREKKPGKTARVFFIAGMVLWVILLWLPPLLVPMVSWDKAAGKYEVGTVVKYWSDKSRTETLGERKGKARELPVQIWYPANQNQGVVRKAPYIFGLNAAGGEMQRKYNIPTFLFSYLENVSTYSELKAKPASGQFPVVLFSHGFPASRFNYTYLAEEMASHGYVVVAMEHTYHSLITTLGDGRAASLVKTPSPVQLNAWDKIIDNIWSRDTSFILDQLEKVQAGTIQTPLKEKLDLTRIAVAGHSFGGANAADSLMKDSRIKIGANLDGTFFGSQLQNNKLTKPFLYVTTKPIDHEKDIDMPPQKQLNDMNMSKEQFKHYAHEIKKREEHALQKNTDHMVIKDAKHLSFSDIYLYSPVLGPSPEALHEKVRSSMVAFLDTNFKK
ncbi:alpha/beta hydrolase family protein [Fictibacillus fluitans]|uniref:Carboxylic ester hydrolase n=1 Tax=Fictibacillus fluitans TaxID=3058422 RepID=A0ABT8HUT9_9BACL|nr:hypothetical protein [Fictibacillus sp. NE201]MDN4524027.1 hypothetical protein [Fictibacillus sp. NE201]